LETPPRCPVSRVFKKSFIAKQYGWGLSVQSTEGEGPAAGEGEESMLLFLPILRESNRLPAAGRRLND